MTRCSRFLTAAAAAVVLVATAGCLRLDLDIEVRADDKVDGRFTAAWSEEFLDSMADGEDGLRQADLDAFFDALFEGVPDSKRSRYRDEGYVGETAAIHGEPLADFAEFGGEEWGYLTIDRDGRTYTVDGYWDLRMTGFLDPEILEDAEIRLSVNFPADVTEHNGELRGRTVTWTMSPGDEYRLEAQAVRHDVGRWALVTVGATLGVLVLLWAWQATRLRRHSVGASR